MQAMATPVPVTSKTRADASLGGLSGIVDLRRDMRGWLSVLLEQRFTVRRTVVKASKKAMPMRHCSPDVRVDTLGIVPLVLWMRQDSFRDSLLPPISAESRRAV